MVLIERTKLSDDFQSHEHQFHLHIRDHSTTTWTEFFNFLTPTPLRGQFLYPERGQKQTILDPLHLVQVVIECPLYK